MTEQGAQEKPWVRQLVQGDRTAWASMRHALWVDLEMEEHLAEIDALLSQAGARAYGAFDPSGLAVAFAEFSLRPYANGCTETPVPFLEGIWVAEGWRRQGVGSLLLAAAERALTDEGFTELCSDAALDNLSSHRAHARWGFEETERVVYFRKALSRS